MPRRNLSIKERIDLIEDRENNNLQNNELCEKYKVSRWTIQRVLSKKEPLSEAYMNGQHKKTRLEPEIIERFDGKIVNYILKLSNQGIPITARLIIEYAKLQSTDENFKGSWGWFQRFKERVKLKLGTKHGERLSVDMKKVNDWRSIDIPRIMIDWQKEFIYNCDETALFWRQAPVKTYFIAKTEHIGDRLFKERITILFCVNRAGEKLNPLVINRSVKPRCFYANCLNGLNIIYKAQVNAWMDRNLFWEWLAVLHDDLMRKDKKIVLILDNFSGHKVNYNDFPLITFKFLPSGTTSFTQPLDGGIIKSFKAKYLSMFMKQIIQSINEEHISKCISKIDLLSAIKWIDAAWKQVTSDTIISCWCHSGYNEFSSPNLFSENCDQNELNLLINSLKNLNVNCCTVDEFMDQNNFDFIDPFE